MRRAIELANQHRTHPNPRVGAVVVDQAGNVVGEGAHEGVGKPHAEVVALAQAGELARGSTLYVTLEPCTHQGNTPPCVTAIVTAGVSQVIVGAIDPDERVSGKGVSWLTDARVAVTMGEMPEEAEAVDPAYFHHRRTGLPRVTLKMAMTLDGSIAALDGSSQWITSEEARLDAHLLRSGVDAVVVGAGTLRSDDPELTARIPEGGIDQPRPVILAGGQALPRQAKIWQRDPLVVATRALDIPSGEMAVVDGENNHPDPIESARAMAGAGLLDVLLEGGPTVAGAWWRSEVITRGVFYLAGKIGGGVGIGPLAGSFSTIDEAREVNIRDVRNVGSDLRIEFE
ncbi:MAG: bifunctional diaminohydroxyphosphoribosylaminopyrimidine deaminase/5-amino-6-(5-phosphoribosylamino)uracil reductase RibD [Acidimicrobiia bacterium]